MNYLSDAIRKKVNLDKKNILVKRDAITRALDKYGIMPERFEKKRIQRLKPINRKKHFDEIEGMFLNNRNATAFWDGVIQKVCPRIPSVTPKTALVLSGGGTKGTFQAGALLALKKFNKMPKTWHGIYGTSTGAINALTVGYYGKEAGTKLASVYLSAKDPTKLFALSPTMKKFDNYLKDNFSNNGLKVDLLQLILSDKPEFYLPSSGWDKFTFLLDLITEINTLQDQVKSLVKASGFLSLTPLRNLLKSYFKNKTLDTSIPIVVTTVNMHDGETKFHNITNNSLDRQLDWVIASASQPVVFETYREPGYPGFFHFDGGVRCNVPINIAKNDGAEKIFCILSEPSLPKDERYDVAAPNIATSLLRFVDCACSQMQKDAVSPENGFNDTIERYMVKPLVRIHEGNILNPGLARMNIEHGYMVVALRELGDNVTILENFALVAAITDLFELRKEIHELEKNCMRRLNIIIGGSSHGCFVNEVYYDVSFKKEAIKEIREKKLEVHSLMQTIYDLLGKDPDIFPFCLPATGNLQPHPSDWWLKWEGHWQTPRFRYDDMWILEDYPNPWQRLPIDYDDNGPILEPILSESPPTTLV